MFSDILFLLKRKKLRGDRMIRRRELLWYSVFGTTATFIYFFIRFMSKGWTDNVLVTVTLAQTVAITFSFFANKFFVFKNTGLGFYCSFKQFVEFIAGRFFVIILDLGIAYFFVEKYSRTMISLFHLQKVNYQQFVFSHPIIGPYMGNAYLLNEFIFTVLSQVIATIINYVVSKRIVFNAKKSYEGELVSSS
ncbi:GtrA family protein [Vagococcus sp. AM17-17]|nr:GtrA family protein [Vagococcus sp. AM17-17]